MTQAVCCWCGSALVKVGLHWWCGSTEDACRTRQTRHAQYTVDGRGRVKDFLYVPLPKQTVWHEAVYRRDLTRILVGGAAGPGKSKWLRATLYELAKLVPGFHALLLRKTRADLNQSHLRFMPFEMEQLGGRYVDTRHLAVFERKGEPDSIIRAGHLEDAGAIDNYLSSEYDVIAPDELVTFERDPMLELFSRARSTNPTLFELRGLAHPNPAEELDGSLVLTATNPGGRGAQWVKEFFIDHAPDREEFPQYDPQRWAFFDARLKDNPYIKGGYVKTLQDMREARRRQLLEGDWTVFEGQFFGELRAERDGVPYHARRLALTPGLTWSAGMDWGWNAPGWVGVFAHLPDGHYHLAAEYKFQLQTSEQVATAITALMASLGIARGSFLGVWGDPAMWQKTGAGRGESNAETLIRKGVRMIKADNDRFNGAMRVHELLADDGHGTPWLTVSPECRYWWRSVPALTQDPKNPDDVDTTQDDHPYDGTRYWAMSRPRPTRTIPAPVPGPGTWGFETAWQDAQAKPTGVLA